MKTAKRTVMTLTLAIFFAMFFNFSGISAIFDGSADVADISSISDVAVSSFFEVPSAFAAMECADSSGNSYDYDYIKDEYDFSEQCAEGSTCFFAPNGVHITCTETREDPPLWGVY